MSNPLIIQGGMGVGVSHWPLARAVALEGQLGVVSGTALDLLLVRRLQVGDPGGHLRRALAAFPFPEISQRVLAKWFVPGGKSPEASFRLAPMPSADPSPELLELIVAGNFAEVFLAKDGHAGQIGINFLHKVQLPLLPAIYGAMLAGVDYVLVGAGIPMAVPGVLDRFAAGLEAQLPLEVEDDLGRGFVLRFGPGCLGEIRRLRRPRFLAIVSSATLAQALARRANGTVDGLVVEMPCAGGHNAPPRGAMVLNERGEPRFGPRDVPDLAKFCALGRPFWLAGSMGTAEQLRAARRAGAAGIQVGTPFAFCEESGLDPAIKAQVLSASSAGTLDVFTDPLASPTGFPFKVVRLENTVADPTTYAQRERLCDLGYLRTPYWKPDGSLGYRCPGEPEHLFEAKGGAQELTVGRKCLCNGLVAAVQLGQRRADGYVEPAIVTAGTDGQQLSRFLPPGQSSYSAKEVLRLILDQPVGASQQDDLP
jgi:nitronate monooxygenase